MYKMSLIGIGSGNLSHLTDGAKAAIARSELILIPRKGSEKEDLAEIRREICSKLGYAQIVEFDVPTRNCSDNYLADVDDWHDEIAACWRSNLSEHLPEGGNVSLLIWGDPSLYDSSIRIANRLKKVDPAISFHVIPGITSLQALTAAFGITLNELAEPVLITTGRMLRKGGWPSNVHTVAVMLDSGGAFDEIDPENKSIWWGAYVGMDKETLMSGELKDVSKMIIKRRAELREKHGWIMDVYLIRSSCSNYT
ncbi:MAG: precorrin-6A synthase (deacetylating) [Coxiella sp. RIFCSPHIGHO2_12_FULL_44_14]|nr:MAG: precorrin-6A synthase (deacetylating) [Coxiella sp. RIFCSPHIGHO2_12_FULL_44_14]